MAITLSTTGYCEASDVDALLQQFTIDANSEPTTTIVEGWISEDFDELNALLRGLQYVAPASQAGGSLSSTGTIAAADAYSATDTAIVAQAGSGTLTGTVARGDFFVITGDAQRYAITHPANVDDDGEVSLRFTPALEVDVASGTVITYTAGTSAPAILQKLNALMTAVRVVFAAYSANAEAAESFASPIVAERDRMLTALQSGNYDLPTIEIPENKGSFGTAKLIRT